MLLCAASFQQTVLQLSFLRTSALGWQGWHCAGLIIGIVMQEVLPGVAALHGRSTALYALRSVFAHCALDFLQDS